MNTIALNITSKFPLKKILKFYKQYKYIFFYS